MSPDSPVSSRSGRWPRAFDDPRRYEHGEDIATLQIFDRRVVCVEVVGTFRRDAIPVIQGPLEELFEDATGVELFWDIEEMTAYESEVRDSFVQLFRTNRANWSGLHVLFRSALIGMTVSAVGLIFGGALKSYRDHDKFFAVTERALAQL